MTYKTVRKYWGGRERLTESEKTALSEATKLAGAWPECRGCKRCIGACELIGIEYEGLCARDNN